MEVASLISSFWRRNLGTIDINLENAFGQQYSLLSLIMKKKVKRLVLNIQIIAIRYISSYYVILYLYFYQSFTSVYIKGVSISIVLAYKDNGWNNAVVLNISVYIFVVYRVYYRNKQKIKVGERLIVKFVTDLFYE